MKIHTMLLALTIAIAGSALAETEVTSDTLYRQGIAAERAGDPDAARAAYEQALRLNPKHADARFRLGQVKVRRDTIARQGRQAALTKVILPDVQFSEATLRETLDVLAKRINTGSDGKLSPNFVVQDPGGKLANAKITMQLRNVPASTVLQYILEQTGARARHDEYAIVIQPQ